MARYTDSRSVDTNQTAHISLQSYNNVKELKRQNQPNRANLNQRRSPDKSLISRLVNNQGLPQSPRPAKPANAAAKPVKGYLLIPAETCKGFFDGSMTFFGKGEYANKNSYLKAILRVQGRHAG